MEIKKYDKILTTFHLQHFFKKGEKGLFSVNMSLYFNGIGSVLVLLSFSLYILANFYLIFLFELYFVVLNVVCKLCKFFDRKK